MENILIYSTVAFIVMAIVNYLEKRSKLILTKKQGASYYDLRMNILYKYGGYAFIVFGVLFLAAGLYISEPAFYVLFTSLSAFMVVVGIFSIRMYYRNTVKFDETKIQIIKNRITEKNIVWNDVLAIEKKRMKGYYILTKTGKRHLLHFHLVGLHTLLAIARKKGKLKEKTS